VTWAWLALAVAALASCREDPHSTPAIGAEADGSRVTVEVLNASGRPGLARHGTMALREAGLDVLAFGTADTSVDTTLVLVRRGDRAAGERVARAIPPAIIRMAPDSLPRVDVTVLLGKSWIRRSFRP
jgi:hypothetical protein